MGKTISVQDIFEPMKTTRKKPGVKSRNSPNNNFNLDYDNNHSIWVLLDTTHFAIARSRLLELSRFNLTKEQAQILYVINLLGGAANMSQIASFTLRQRHSVSTLVDRMEKAGLIKKEKVPHKKVFKVTVTKKGRDIYQKVTRKSIEAIFDFLSTAEKRQLASSLEQLHNRARALLGATMPAFAKPR
jgi:DNA-binding MarR family transcriptional regulator